MRLRGQVSTRWRSAVLAGVALAAGLAGVAIGEGEAPGVELVVEVLEADGAVAGAAAAAGIEVIENGAPVAFSDRGPVGRDWRLVLYFDQQLTDPLVFRNAAVVLAERARELAALGSVEVVLGDSEIRRGLAATRDAGVLGDYLSWLRVRESSVDSQQAIRERLRASAANPEEGAGEAADAEAPDGEDAGPAAARRAMAEEAALLADHHDRFLSWVVEHSEPGPKLLLLIGGGFDTDLESFYRPLGAAPETAGPEAAVASSPGVEEMGRVLSAYGWTVAPFKPAAQSDLLLVEDGESEAPEEDTGAETVVEDRGPSGERAVLGVDPRQLLRRARERRERRAALPPVLTDPDRPWRTLADATGGEILTDGLQLTGMLGRLPLRRRLTLAGEERPDPGFHSIEVRGGGAGARAPAAIHAPRWISRLLPETVSAVRARQFLRDELDEGELQVSAVLERSEGLEPSLVVALRLPPGADRPAGPPPMRLTVALPRVDRPPLISHRLLSELRPLAGETAPADREVLYRLPLPGSDGPPEVVAVLVEELDSGRRGTALASLVEDSVFGVAAGPGNEGYFVPGPKVVQLLRPEEAMVMGATTFHAVVSDRQVAQVDFFLDGEKEAVRRSAPFSAVLDLGRLPQTRRVEAVALDAGGRELGRDGMTVNEGGGAFRVWIREPAARGPGQPPPRLAGPVEVVAEVRTPPGSRVARVEYFWRTELVATRFAAPYRQQVVLPQQAPAGFLRVVAHLDDGSVAEDVRFVNTTGPTERLQVDLVELYVVVTDDAGRPVRDLPRERFAVFEDGERQEIATFGDAGSHPLTVGLAIDSSASMFVKLAPVRRAAAEFLRRLEEERDRAFLVGFGGRPRLQRAATTDLGQVVRALDRLQPDGRTAIWESIVFSLVQLQAVPGKKALVVYSDGADEDPDFSYRLCQRFARLVGVPVYVILTNNEIVRTEGKSLNVRGFLGRLRQLTAAVGGRVYLTRLGADLDAVYAEIAEELRSQYLVGYYAPEGSGEEWRRLEVRVREPGLTARTIAGYYR